MVPVRKPGRPLSSCACAPGRPCTCGGGVRVAIPKMKRCPCGPGEEEPEDTELEPSMQMTACPITVAAWPNTVYHRVAKTPSSARKGARKQSVHSFEINMDRVDPTSVNVLNGYSVAGPGMVSPVLNGGVASTQLPRSRATVAYADGLPAGAYPARLQLGHGHGNVASSTYTITAPLPSPARPLTFSHAHESESEQEAKDFGPLSAMTAAIPSWPTTSMDGAMNGSVKVQSISMPEPFPTSKAAGANAGGSCSCGGAKNKAEKAEAKAGSGVPRQDEYGFVPRQFQHLAYQPQLTTVTYPAQYGSWQNPINPTIWQQLFAQQQSMTLVPPLPGNGGEMAPAPNEGAAGTSHQCSCGPGCKCIGCLAHPYNSETLAYIQNAYENTGANEAATAHPPGSIPQGADMYVNGNGQTDGSVHDGVEVATATATAAPPHRGSIPVSLTTDTKATEPPPPSPPTAHTPSDASGISNEEQLPMTDFLFLDMPFDGTGFPTLGLDGCDGNYAACLCGPGCQCDGCEVHNRPGAT